MDELDYDDEFPYDLEIEIDVPPPEEPPDLGVDYEDDYRGL